MTVITVRLNKEEERVFKDYAESNNISLPTLLKNSLIEKIEDEIDLKIIDDYEKMPKGKLYSQVEVEKMFDIEWNTNFQAEYRISLNYLELKIDNI